MMRPKVIEDRIHTDREKYPAWVEVGKTGARVHIPFDPANLDEALENVDHCFLIRDYAVIEHQRIEALKSSDRVEMVMDEVRKTRGSNDES